VLWDEQLLAEEDAGEAATAAAMRGVAGGGEEATEKQIRTSRNKRYCFPELE